VLKFYIDIWK